MAELVDALDLGSSVLRRESSSLSSRTIFINDGVVLIDESMDWTYMVIIPLKALVLVSLLSIRN